MERYRAFQKHSELSTRWLVRLEHFQIPLLHTDRNILGLLYKLSRHTVDKVSTKECYEEDFFNTIFSRLFKANQKYVKKFN